MKKILLAVFTILLVGVTYAQSQKAIAGKKAVAVPYKNVQITGREAYPEPDAVSPVMRSMSRDFIGTTYYDLQTNGSMSSRIVAHQDGTVSAIWTTGHSNASRGTGYNYYDGSSWVNPFTSTSRIENTRTGWGTYANVGDAEIVFAHDGSASLVISSRPHKGQGNWSYSNLNGPTIMGINNNGQPGTSTALLWPAVATSGNTIHLIACTESDTGFYYHGINTCLVYYRGTYNENTNTITWEQPRVVGDVTSADVKRFSGDSYAIAAKNNTVAIVATPGMKYDNFIWKSTDNGVNFTKTVFCESALKSDEYAMLDTTLYIPDGSCAVAVGDDGKVHVAMGTFLTVADSASVLEGSYWWYPMIGYTLYWNESINPILFNNNREYMSPEALTEMGCKVVETVNLDCDDSHWSFNGITWTKYGVGPVSQPQLVAQNGNVYLTFNQILGTPFFYLPTGSSTGYYFRGVFGTKMNEASGEGFEDFSWLSYNKDCYYLSSWDFFPMDTTSTLSDFIETVESEGESVFPAVAPALVNGKIHMIWQQDYIAGCVIKEVENASISSDESFIYYFSMDADSIGIYNNTDEVCQGLWIDHTGISNKKISGIKMYPNPASESVNLTFSAENAEKGVVSVMNLMGQTVYTQNVEITEGYNMVTIPVKQFNPGVYMVTMRTNTGISTQKLIVK